MGHPVVENAVAIAVEVHGSKVTIMVEVGALAVCVTAITDVCTTVCTIVLTVRTSAKPLTAAKVETPATPTVTVTVGVDWVAATSAGRVSAASLGILSNNLQVTGLLYRH